MTIKAIFLDWDGTLIDSFSLNLTAINDTLAHFGKEPISEELYRESFGFSSRELFGHLFSEEIEPLERTKHELPSDAHDDRVLLDTQIEEILEEKRSFYYAIKKELGETTPLEKIDGSEELIAFLREKKKDGLFVGVISNKKQGGLFDQIEQSGWGDVFDVAVGKTPDRKGKPSPDPLNKALEAYEGKRPPLARETLYIGDTDVDCKFSRENGLKFVGMGDAITERLEPGEHVHHLDELTAQLQKMDLVKSNDISR